MEILSVELVIFFLVGLVVGVILQGAFYNFLSVDGDLIVIDDENNGDEPLIYLEVKERLLENLINNSTLKFKVKRR